MGIFDDAIRQHLDLKRRQGAEETELKQLEDEAFGPPARPGDPEFGDTGEQEATDVADEAGAVPEAEAPATAEFDADAPAATEADAGSVEGPAPELASSTEESAFTTAEREAIAEQPTTFFDQQGSEPPLELEDLDLELDIEDELDEVGALEEQTGVPGVEVEAEAAEPEVETPAPVPDTIEHEHEHEPEPEPEPVEPDPAAEPDVLPASEPEQHVEEDEASEDVLEETPEFLRDNPDDDELWFEQGQPKDFDF